MENQLRIEKKKWVAATSKSNWNQVIQTENNQSECIQKATDWRAASPRKKFEGILERNRDYENEREREREVEDRKRKLSNTKVK